MTLDQSTQHMHLNLLRKITLGAVFTALSLSWVSGQPLPSLPEDELPDLRDEIQRALTQSPQVIIRQAEAAASLSDYDSAKSMRYPVFGGSLSYYRVEDDRNTLVGARPGNRLYYNFSASMPLFHWGSVNRTIRNSEIYTLIDRGYTRLAYLSLTGSIRRQYLDLIRFKRTLLRARHGLEINKSDLVQALEKRDQNLMSEAEVIGVRLTKQRGDLAVAEAEDYLQNAINAYARLTGGEPLRVEDIPDDFPKPDLEADAPLLASLLAGFIADEMPENTAVIQAKYNLEISQNDLKNTRTTLRPKFNLVAGFSQDEQDFALTADDYAYKSTFGGVSLTWNLFDGFATRARVKSSLARLRAAELKLAQQQQALLDDAQAIGKDLNRLALSVDIAEQELQSAQSHLEYSRAQQERGEASETDVLWAVLALHDAVGGALYHRTNYWNRVTDLLVMVEVDPTLDAIPTELR